MRRHQYGISALVSQTSFGRETSSSGTKNVRCILRLNEQVCINICDLMIARLEHRSCFILFTKERLDKFVLSLCPFFLLLQDHWNHKILKIADVTFRKIKDCGR